MRPDEECPADQMLAKWYAGHSAIRRLWAIRELQGTRVVLALQPTNDGDDVYPVWLANAGAWARELQLRLGAPVRLEVVDESALAGMAAEIDAVLALELSWRDASER